MSAFTETEVRSQLEYMDFLASGGIPVVNAMATLAGDRIAKAGDTHALLFKWIDGQALDETLDAASIQESGALLAQLHVRSREFQPSADFHRRSWREIYAPKDNSWLDGFFADGVMDSAGHDALRSAVERTNAAVARLSEDPSVFGMIHADFHPTNLLRNKNGLHIIDFDDCGWAHWLFDITWPAALLAKKHGSTLDFLGEYLRGYEQVRPLSAVERELLPEFMLACAPGMAEMVYTAPIDQRGKVAQGWYAYVVKWVGELVGGV
jgi:Ser/Thr protein kinase RdoA (MazF antagonist)